MEELRSIKDLGNRSGKLIFFGGVYSNLQALQALKEWAEQNKYPPENVFCTGDILGYCAQPIECITLLKEWNINAIAGNVELQIRNDKDECGCDFTSGGRCDLFSKTWYRYIQSQVDDNAKEWLKQLPEFIKIKYGNNHITIVHGSWFNTSEFIFKSTPWQNKQENFKATQSNIIIAGHCGLPFADVRDDYKWLNAGVIGMPANDGTPRVWFLTTDDDNGELNYQFHSFNYDHHTAGSLMAKNNLPASYANTLSTGIWDNCEILPEEETKQQGKALQF
jgi:predicted phosphodiesterase